MSFYRKKPVVIEAIQWDGSMDNMEAINAHWPELRTTHLSSHNPSRTVREWGIGTLEGHHKVSVGDYIIKGVKGEFYPCKPDIFELTYEANDALRTALTEALAQQSQTTGCTSNCDNCTYAHGSPAHAGYCYMFYDEPQGVCGQWKDANSTIENYPEKDISAQPAREPLSNEQIKKGQKEGYDVDDRPEPWAFREGVKFAERAHGIGGDK